MSRVNKLLRLDTCFMLQAGVAVAPMKSGCGRAPRSLLHAWRAAEARAGSVTPRGKGQAQPERFEKPC